MESIKLSEFKDGAIDERFNDDLQRVMENMHDLNTDPLKVRKITLTFTLKGNEERNLTNVMFDSKVTLAPANGIEATLLLDHDEKGNPVAAELKSGARGQLYMADTGEVLDDKGKPAETESKPSKLIKFQ